MIMDKSQRLTSNHLQSSNVMNQHNTTNETQREGSPYEIVHNEKSSMKVYKDGKIISYNAGTSLLQQKGNRLMEDKTINNINSHFYDVKKKGSYLKSN